MAPKRSQKVDLEDADRIILKIRREGKMHNVLKFESKR